MPTLFDETTCPYLIRHTKDIFWTFQVNKLFGQSRSCLFYVDQMQLIIITKSTQNPLQPTHLGRSGQSTIQCNKGLTILTFALVLVFDEI